MPSNFTCPHCGVTSEGANPVWERSKSTGIDKLVLLALLECSSDGVTAWPSISTLAKMTGVSESTVRRSLAALNKSGEIFVEPGGRQHQTNTYNMTPVTGCQLDRGQGCQDDGGQGVRGVKLTGVRGVNLTPPTDADLTDFTRVDEGRDGVMGVKLTGVRGVNLTPDLNISNNNNNKYIDLPLTEPTKNEQTDAAADDQIVSRYWGACLAIVQKWQMLTGSHTRLSSKNEEHKADYYAPALSILNEFDGDGAAAWEAIRAEYDRMIIGGMIIRRLSAVSAGVMASVHRAGLPAGSNGVVTPSGEAAWKKVTAAASRNSFADCSEVERAAIRAAGGVQVIRMRTIDNEPKIKALFLGALHEQQQQRTPA